MELFLENFRGIFDEVDTSIITLDTKFREIEEWDSLTALSFIAMVDDKYSVKFTGEEIRNSLTVLDLYEVLAKKL
jgi:acyl carrier protein